MQRNLVLTSTRLHPDTLEKINLFLVHHKYWNKNAVINNVLTAVFKHFDDRDIYDMVRTNSFKENPITAIYRINELPKPKNNPDEQ